MSLVHASRNNFWEITEPLNKHRLRLTYICMYVCTETFLLESKSNLHVVLNLKIGLAIFQDQRNAPKDSLLIKKKMYVPLFLISSKK